MEKQEITIINYEPKNFVDKKTGEVTEMILIHYVTKIDDIPEKFYGYAYLECYLNGKQTDTIKQYIMRKAVAELAKVPTNNGFKFSLMSIDNKKLR